jgi:hypothetical protein
MHIVKATGFSRQYVSLVRRGPNVPQPAHHESPARLLGAADCERT